MTIGYISESIDPTALGAQLTNNILGVLVSAMAGSEVRGCCEAAGGASARDAHLGFLLAQENPPVRLAALNALLEAVEFIESNMAVEKERTAILQVVCANATVSSSSLSSASPSHRGASQLPIKEVRVAAMQVLVEVARLYYEYLPAYIQALFNITLRLIKTDEEAVAQQAIEFWATIAEIEGKLFSICAHTFTAVHWNS